MPPRVIVYRYVKVDQTEVDHALAAFTGIYRQGTVVGRGRSPVELVAATRQLRIALGIRQEDVATAIGVTRSSVAQLETSPRPRPTTALAYAAALAGHRSVEAAMRRRRAVARRRPVGQGPVERANPVLDAIASPQSTDVTSAGLPTTEAMARRIRAQIEKHAGG